jgi:holliday junction DNA helicase RuvA
MQSRYYTEMIGKIEGVVQAIRTEFAIISAGGIGYKVAATRETLAVLRDRKNTSLWTHLAVRENALDLYGFLNEKDLRFFELLLTVSGIGPKSALAVLDIASVETLRSAITAGNASYLTKVSGIGKKTANKIVAELKDSIDASKETAHTLSEDEGALEALRALGYSAQEARDVLRKVPRTVEGESARLREALRLIGDH